MVKNYLDDHPEEIDKLIDSSSEDSIQLKAKGIGVTGISLFLGWDGNTAQVGWIR